MKKLVISMLLTGLVFCFAAAAEPAPKVDSEAPALELSNLEGKIVNLQDYVGKKPVVLSFLASWSNSCQGEFADLQSLYSAHAASVEVIAVSFDKKAKDLKTFVEKNEIGFTVLLDKKLSMLDRFQILIIPTTFCINKNGIIEKIFVDYDDNVKGAIAEWLKSS